MLGEVREEEEEEEEEEEDFVPAHCLTTQMWVLKTEQWLRNVRTH